MNSPWALQFSNKAKKSIDRLPSPFRRRMERLVGALAVNPRAGKPLKGQMKGLFSLRVWPYRIIYAIQEAHRIVQIVDVAHRQGVYK